MATQTERLAAIEDQLANLQTSVNETRTGVEQLTGFVQGLFDRLEPLLRRYEQSLQASSTFRAFRTMRKGNQDVDN